MAVGTRVWLANTARLRASSLPAASSDLRRAVVESSSFAPGRADWALRHSTMLQPVGGRESLTTGFECPICFDTVASSSTLALCSQQHAEAFAAGAGSSKQPPKNGRELQALVDTGRLATLENKGVGAF